MKRALLLHAKQRFIEMKSRHEQQSTGPESSPPRLAAPISPTPDPIIDAFLPQLGLAPGSLFIDLGCGDGRWLIAAHKQTGCRGLGVDVDEERLKMAKESIREDALQGRVRVCRRDVFEFVTECDDVREADAIVLYLFREAMVEMGALLRRRLFAGNREGGNKRVQILSVGFALTGWVPKREDKINGIRVYLYSTDNT